jgi:hypothetical protein
MSGVVVVIFVLGAVVLSPFAFFQVITKAGYSGWWTFVPYAPWIVGLVGAFTTSAFVNHQSLNSTLNQDLLWDVLEFLTAFFVMVMFFVFAFSAWPSLRQRRPSGQAHYGSPGGARPMQPSWISMPATDAQVPAAAVAVPAAPAAQEQPPGWHRIGAMGAGEQGYWDGQAWTARRQWKNGAWVDLPMAAGGPGAAGAVESV